MTDEQAKLEYDRFLDPSYERKAALVRQGSEAAQQKADKTRRIIEAKKRKQQRAYLAEWFDV